MSDDRRIVVLIHGAWHGPWCWREVVPLLESRRFEVVAVDLPVSDPMAGHSVYADAVVRQISATDRKVIVVAHSMACVVAPLLCERLEVSDLILVAGPIVEPGLSLAEQMASGRAAIGEQLAALTGVADDGLMHIPPEDAMRVFFHDCPPEVAAWAAANLRPQAVTVLTEPSPLRAWPDVRTHYVFGRWDKALPAEWVVDNVTQQLGIDPVAMDTGHSPFLSRPGEFTDIVSAMVAIEGEPD